MDQVKLKASVRNEIGTQKVKKLRNKGVVPGVVYFHGKESVAVSVGERELSHIIQAAGGDNIIISLTVENDKAKRARPVIIKEVQHHPVKRDILHIDFNEISMNEKIEVDVEVVAKGEAPGVKEGGMLEQALHAVKVKALPADIPKHIDADISGLKLNEGIHVKDLKFAPGVEVLTDPEALLVQVKVHVEEVPEEAPAEGAEEPEVIREKKEGAEGEAGKKEEGKKEEGKKEEAAGKEAKKEPEKK